MICLTVSSPLCDVRGGLFLERATNTGRDEGARARAQRLSPDSSLEAELRAEAWRNAAEQLCGFVGSERILRVSLGDAQILSVGSAAALVRSRRNHASPLRHRRKHDFQNKGSEWAVACFYLARYA